MECERCGSSENTKQFMFFENEPDEVLCWECRKPIIYDRVAGLGENNEDSADEPELSGQVTIGDY